MKVEQSVIEVVISVQNSRIEGNMHLPSGGRLTDYLALPERKFIPLTEAKIFSIPGNELLYVVPFLSLNKAFIIYIFPKDKEEKDNKQL
ncbi:MAG: hypothetical protein KKH34_02495 [Candidatus Omnitrophica bacterium]|nr:hypothetical protein [Candidatus Omnitrophota bacterium]MCG2704113.1 hypothetical protein [Candidatus Omnitrophota bacterium]